LHSSTTSGSETAVMGLILGSAVNTNGRASSLTAPNGPAQQLLLREALGLSARLHPSDIDGIQMHSNGTSLGDPIEVGAISAVLLEGASQGASLKREKPFFFATVKGYTGHQESGAGVAGLMEAAVLAQHAALPPALHLRNLNPHTFGALSVHAVAIGRGGPSALPMISGERRLQLGVSSFGAQGTNAHAVVAGSGAPASIVEKKLMSATGDGNNNNWKLSRLWVCPPARSLLSLAIPISKKKSSGGLGRGKIGRVIFETNLVSSRLSYLNDLKIYGRASLGAGTSISMAASALQVLLSSSEGQGAMVLADLALVAPQPMLQMSEIRKQQPCIGTITVMMNSGTTEVSMFHEKLLQGRFTAGIADGSLDIEGVEGESSESGEKAAKLSPAVRSILLQQQNQNNVADKEKQQQRASALATTMLSSRDLSLSSTTSATDLSSYAVHPTLFEAATCQAASFTLGQQLSWVRSIAAVSISSPSPSPSSGNTNDLALMAMLKRKKDIWAAGSSSLVSESGPAITTLTGVVLGEHDVAPSSPAPHYTGEQVEEGVKGTEEAAEDEDGLGIDADNPLLTMSEEERTMHLQALVMTEVRNMVGHAIHPDEPLMSAGLDSRGGMELRRNLADSVGLQLPVTLLYDYQNVNSIVEFIGETVQTAAAGGVGGSGTGRDEDSSDEDDEGEVGRGRGNAAAAAAAAGPSELLKTLRPEPISKPLFLAAPGVANAQSAYFSFSQFLQWSTQPIYVLDKDNDLDLRALALQNAHDIVAIQPEGPYLLGGHSYGGAVAVEIAMVLEELGHEVALVLIMDTPLTKQIRPGKPDAEHATDEDCLELMEMILGALGRDALGLGSSIAHPKESDEWKGMTMDQRYEFFAPIWRVMRDSNMNAEEVKEQIQYVALVTKQASTVSDLRHHTYTAESLESPVVYFRAMTEGVCTYFDDRKQAPVPHGACWYDVCKDLEVVDIPGDHFSILRQDEADMNVIITQLKLKLAPHGWSETVRRDQKKYTVGADEIRDIDAYLRKMGIDDPGLRMRLESALPYAGGAQGVEGALSDGDGIDDLQPIIAINAAAVKLQKEMSMQQQAGQCGGMVGSGNEGGDGMLMTMPVLAVCMDANRTLGGMEASLSRLDVPCFAVRVPADVALWEAPDVSELALLARKALRERLGRHCRLIIGGVGFGGILAHELALQLDREGSRAVEALALFEGHSVVNNPTVTLNWLSDAARDEVCQVAALVLPMIQSAVAQQSKDGSSSMPPTIDSLAVRLASIDGYDEQLDYIASFKPEQQEAVEWDQKVDALLGRLAYFKSITAAYSASDIFAGQTLLFASSNNYQATSPTITGNGHGNGGMTSPGGSALLNSSEITTAAVQNLARGGPGGTWRAIRFMVQPVAAHAVPAGHQAAASSIQSAIMQSIARRADAEDIASIGGLALMSPVPAQYYPHHPIAGVGGMPMTPTSTTALATPNTATPGPNHSRRQTQQQQVAASSSPSEGTYTVITPLNRLCPERRYILRKNSGPPAGGLSLVKPVTRVPVWLLHTERGDISVAQKELAASLPMPCYGLAMGPDAEMCVLPSAGAANGSGGESGLNKLAEEYCTAIISMQPAGPYILVGSSIAGAALAHAVAAKLDERQPPTSNNNSNNTGLIILDGCVGCPPLPLHDPTWYALFYLMREIGSFEGTMGEFVDYVRNAGSPSQQLKLISELKPTDMIIGEDAWDAAVYTTLDRSSVLKRLIMNREEEREGEGEVVFRGPTALILPRGRLGRLFAEASEKRLEEEQVIEIGLEERHTECLLSKKGRQSAVIALTDAVSQLLQRLG
jgi:thioesterase domain-containing protein